MHLQQAALAEALHLELPDHIGVDPALSDQGQAKGVLNFHPGQARRGVEHGGQF